MSTGGHPAGGSPSPLLPAAFLTTALVLAGAGNLFWSLATREGAPSAPATEQGGMAYLPPSVQPIAPADLDLLRTAMREAGFGAEPAPEDPVQVAALPAEPVPAIAPVPVEATGGAAAPPSARMVPLPVPRPPGLSARESLRVPREIPTRSARRRAAPAAPVVATAEEPSLFDRLFGVSKPPSPALAYAALGGSEAEKTFRKSVDAVPSISRLFSPGPSAGTAIYDITAQTVRMPNGETLEAHSGLGESMDQPHHAHLVMRGPTPPGTYDLTEREAPFHGVRAIRLTPTGGGPAPHGRVGLLAHTYMLRSQPGASNGCVVFKDYDRFLQAYLRGEVKRLVVVARGA